MKRLRIASSKLAGLFGRDRHDAELRDELESLAALQFDEQLAAGVDPAEARRQVIARTGSVTAVQEAVREQRGLGWLEALWRDGRLGVRLLRRNPLFASTAVLSLALGIGSNAAIFSIIDHLLLRPLPVRNADRLMLLDHGSWTYPIWDQFRQRADAFGGAAAYANETLLTRVDGRSAREDGLFVSGSLFEVLGASTALGRPITPADDRRGGGPDGPVVVISHAYWDRQFGRDPGVLGRTILIERVPFTIVGVAERRFFGPEVGRSFSVAIPFGTEPLIRGTGSSLDERQNWWLEILFLRRPGQSEDQVRSAVRAMHPTIRSETMTRNPEYLRDNFEVLNAEHGRSTLRRRYRDSLWILMGAAVVVLLVTCANVANLLLARAMARRAEMGVRLAMGASRARLVGQLLIEGLVLSAVGAVMGLAFAVWTARLIVGQLSTVRETVMLGVALDWHVFLFTAAIACVSTPLFAVLPALRATRLAPGDAVKEQSRTLAGDGSHALGQALVLGQIALSLALVVLAGLLVGTFTRLAWRPLGLESQRVVVADVMLQPDSVAEAERLAFFDRLRHLVRDLPGIGDASLAVITPLSGRGWNGGVQDVDGTEVAGTDQERTLWVNAVSDGFFATYGIAMRQGRDISPADVSGTPKVVVVNEAFVRRFLGGGPALGRRIRQGVRGRPETYSEYVEVVGVAADAVYFRDLRRETPPTMFVPLAQVDGPPRESISIGARVRAAESAPMVGEVTRALEAADARLTVHAMAHEVLVHNALTQERLIATVAGLFGGLALLLAVVGLYGVTAYTVSRRRSEIGVRLALGATPPRVLGLVLRRVAALVTLGIAAGVVLSLWIGEAVRVLLHGLEPNDPMILTGAALVLLLTGGLAGALPAWRAARTDPAVALRD